MKINDNMLIAIALITICIIACAYFYTNYKFKIAALELAIEKGLKVENVIESD